MHELEEPPEGVEKYSETPIFTETSTPAKLLQIHDTKPDVWGRIVVLEGALDYIIPGPPERVLRLDPKRCGVIRPAEPHRVALIGAVRFKVEFLKAV